MKALSLKGVLADAARRGALDWDTFREGIEISWVYRVAAPESPSAAFLKYAPGAKVPMHEHPGLETILVLEGAQSDDNGTHRAGDMVINPPGTRHAVVSEDGCLVLAIWQADVEFI